MSVHLFEMLRRAGTDDWQLSDKPWFTVKKHFKKKHAKIANHKVLC